MAMEPSNSKASYHKPYTKMTAEVYDQIYAQKNYPKEAGYIKQVIAQLKQTDGHDLLDVACGTGSHIPFLKDSFTITGLDLSPEQLDYARQRFPDLEFHQADMLDFNFNKRFDVVTCLFGSIGYANRLADMRRAVVNMANHLQPGGLLLIDPWFMDHEINRSDRVSATFVDQPELKISRITSQTTKGKQSILDMHHLVGSPASVEYFSESHIMGIYSESDYLQAIEATGLKADQRQFEGAVQRPFRLMIGS